MEPPDPSKLKFSVLFRTIMLGILCVSISFSIAETSNEVKHVDVLASRNPELYAHRRAEFLKSSANMNGVVSSLWNSKIIFLITVYVLCVPDKVIDWSVNIIKCMVILYVAFYTLQDEKYLTSLNWFVILNLLLQGNELVHLFKTFVHENALYAFKQVWDYLQKSQRTGVRVPQRKRLRSPLPRRSRKKST